MAEKCGGSSYCTRPVEKTCAGSKCWLRLCAWHWRHTVCGVGYKKHAVAGEAAEKVIRPVYAGPSQITPRPKKRGGKVGMLSEARAMLEKGIPARRVAAALRIREYQIDRLRARMTYEAEKDGGGDQ